MCYIKEMFVLLPSFGRAYGRYLVPKLSYFQCTDGKTEKQNRTVA